MDMSVCVGSGTQMRCGMACVDTSSDAQNCGGCGIACGTGAQCCDSVCAKTASCSFAVTKVSPVSGWQNGGDYLTLEGHGFAAGMRVHIGDGRAPVRVIDLADRPARGRPVAAARPAHRHDGARVHRPGETERAAFHRLRRRGRGIRDEVRRRSHRRRGDPDRDL